jgi:hypothetical protein
VFFANILDDEERFQGIIDDMIEKGEMKKLTTGAPTTKAKTAKIKKVRKREYLHFTYFSFQHTYLSCSP